MNYETTKKLVASFKKGTIRTMEYSKELKTRKGVTDKITKKTVIQIRTGVKYDNIASVQESRRTGQLPVENQGLPSHLIWVDDNFIKNTQTGKIMLRVAYANGHKTKTRYFKNGEEVTKAEIENLCLKSETAPKNTVPTVFNIGVENIISIK